jgi:hypothetical protein
MHGSAKWPKSYVIRIDGWAVTLLIVGSYLGCEQFSKASTFHAPHLHDVVTTRLEELISKLMSPKVFPNCMKTAPGEFSEGRFAEDPRRGPRRPAAPLTFRPRRRRADWACRSARFAARIRV